MATQGHRDEGQDVHSDDEPDGRADLGQLDAQAGEHASRDPIRLADETEEDVLGPDVVVVEALRLLLGKREHAAGAL